VTIATAAAAAAAVTMGSAPAALADTSPTTATFTLSSTGLLTIAAQANADLGSHLTSDTSVSGSLGSVEVADLTSPDNGTWTATVAMTTPFHTLTGASSNETIPNTDVSYDPGTSCTVGGPGTGTFTPGAGGVLDVTRPAFAGSALFGDTTCTWLPALTVTLPAGSPVGTYTGALLHSVTAGTP
jgi:hypothetical protein